MKKNQKINDWIAENQDLEIERLVSRNLAIEDKIYKTIMKIYIKEKELIALGFERTDVTAEESGYETDWYYYSLDFGLSRSISLITPSNTEIQDGKWYAEVFEDESIRFTNSSDIMAFIDLINRNIIK